MLHQMRLFVVAWLVAQLYHMSSQILCRKHLCVPDLESSTLPFSSIFLPAFIELIAKMADASILKYWEAPYTSNVRAFEIQPHKRSHVRSVLGHIIIFHLEKKKGINYIPLFSTLFQYEATFSQKKFRKPFLKTKSSTACIKHLNVFKYGNVSVTALRELLCVSAQFLSTRRRWEKKSFGVCYFSLSCMCLKCVLSSSLSRCSFPLLQFVPWGFKRTPGSLAFSRVTVTE